MKICFDAFSLSHLPNTGLYSYSYELINSLLNVYPQPQYSLITNNGGNEIPFNKGKGLAIDLLDIDRKKNDYSLIGNYLSNNKIRLYHSLNNGFSIPDEKECKYVVTIHDMLPMSDKTLVDDKYFNKHINLVPKALEKADKVIAVSNFVREELVKYYDVPQDKIEVVYPIVSKGFKDIWEVHSKNFMRKHYDITDDYVLYAGGLHERKQLPLLLSTFKEVIKREANLKLLIVGSTKGKREHHYINLLNDAKKLGIAEKVHFLGPIPYKHMPYIYNAANCFLNLSTYEGYPLAAVEAKECGTSIVCLENSSFKEVLGNYPTYIKTIEPKVIADKVLESIYRSSEIFMANSSKHSTVEEKKPVNQMINIYESLMYIW